MEVKKIAVVSNTAWSIWNFRRGLITALISRGHEVVALAPAGPFAEQISRLGCRFVPLRHLAPKGTQICQDLLLIRELHRIFKTEKFDWALSYTIKPNLYTGMAAGRLALRTLPTVNGLGFVFQQKNLLSTLAKLMFRGAFRRANPVFFQNADDLAFFLQNGLVSTDRTGLVAGSGVNLNEFQPTPGKNFEAAPVFLFAGRLVAEKGVQEYIQAAEMVKKVLPGVRFFLAGLEADNPNALSVSTLRSKLDPAFVELLPPTHNMSSLMDTVDCVVLPSYYGEGVPRVLLEALAKGLPVITTDQPGCRDTVDAGSNGWLVPPREVGALVEAMFAFCQMSPQLRAVMGRASRAKAAQTFDEQKIIQKYLDIIEA